MAYHVDRETGDLVIDGFEQGIAPSPHKGIANIQCANIATETGEVMANYARVQQNQIQGSAVITPLNTNTLIYTSSTPILPGAALLIQGSTITGLADSSGYAYIVATVVFVSGTTYHIQLFGGGAPTVSVYNGIILTGLGATGSAGGSFQRMGPGIQGTTEYYLDANSIEQNRYYVLDEFGYVYVQDTAFTGNAVGTWQLIDNNPLDQNYSGIDIHATGLAVYDGWLHAMQGNTIYVKFTSILGANPTSTTPTLVAGWAYVVNGRLNISAFLSPVPHYAFVGHASTLNFTDSNSVSTIYATSGTPNVFTYGTVTFDNVPVFTISQIAGQSPIVGQRVTFISSDTMPTGLSINTTYFVISAVYTATRTTFKISATKGGASISAPTGGAGTLYCISYNPAGASSTDTYTVTQGACTLPSNETAKCLAEVGNQIIIGCESNTVYFWDQAPVTTNLANGVTIVSTPFTSFLVLAESNVQQMLTVSNLAYIFAGQKGNVYVTSGSSVSPVLTVPDYTTGQVEPYFTWGGVAYIRGRIFFSIKDSNSKTGGIWSFIPTQNYYPQQDTGLSLRLENQSSYGTYDGYSTVLIANVNQNARGVQYFSMWFDGTSTYGIDASATTPYTGGQTIIESDVIPTGTILAKKTFKEVEYKLAAPLVSGESVQLYYRLNLTDSFTSLGSVIQETSTPYSGYFVANFQNTQWLQIKAASTSTVTNPSFCRLVQIRVR